MKTTNTEKSLKEIKENFRVSVISLFDLEGFTNDNLANLITNNFEYYVDSLLSQAKRETVEGERSRVRVRLNNFRKKQRNNGKCLYCKNDALKGFTSCKEHKERRRLLQKNNRALKREWKSGKLVPCPKCKGEWYNEKYKTICDVCEGVGKVAQGGKEVTFKKAKQDATCTIHGEKGCFHSLNDLKSHLTDKK